MNAIFNIMPDPVFSVIIFAIGLFCIITSKNIVRMIIGIEVMARAVTLSIISSGYIHGNTSISQALVITVIVIEVVVSATALALIMNVYKHTGSLDVNKLTKLKG